MILRTHIFLKSQLDGWWHALVILVLGIQSLTYLWPTSVFFSVEFQASETFFFKRLMLPLEQYLRLSLASTCMYTPPHMCSINTHTHSTVLHIYIVVFFFLAAQLSVDLLPTYAKIIGLWEGRLHFAASIFVFLADFIGPLLS